MRSHRLLPVTLLALWIVLLSCLAAVPASAQTPTPPVPDPAAEALRAQHFATATGQMGTLPDEEKLPARQTGPLAPGDASSWANITFQVWVDNNYELFSINAYGQGLIRLTNNSANDGWPRINPSGTAVVFTSDRDGDLEIFSMAIDGSNQRQLTFNTWSDAAPCWSPDGQKIAFISRTSGSYELYVMNVDGSGLTRIVSASDEDILYPAWSPDGTKIAYTAWPKQGYASYVNFVAPDGSGHTKIYEAYPGLKERLVWSPDGNSLYMDNFRQYAPFSRIIYLTMNNSAFWDVTISTENSYEDQLAGDVYLGSDGGAALVWVRAAYVLQNNQYLLDHTTLELLPVRSSTEKAVKLATGILFAPDRKSRDVQPPVTHLKALPEYSRWHGFPLEWTVENPGLAPLAGFELQGSSDTSFYNSGGNFVPDGLLAQSGFFSPSLYGGNRLYLRLRAWDDAGNYEAWPPQNSYDASTTLYTIRLSGSLADSRGIPLSGVMADIPYRSANYQRTGADGRYQLWMLMSNSSFQDWPVFGYGRLPGTDLPAQNDLLHNLYYPSLDNQVNNGTFEASGFGAWAAGGSLPAGITTSRFVTGAQSASLGSCSGICASDPMPTGLSGASSVLLADRDGQLHVLAFLPGSGVFYAKRPPQGDWAAPLKIADLSANAAAPGPILQQDAHGALHALWFDGANGYFSSLPSGGVWSLPQSLPAQNCLDASFDTEGTLHLLYRNDPALIYQKLLPGGWSQPLVINPNRTAATLAKIAVGPDGWGQVIWVDSAGLEYRAIRPGGALTSLENMYDYRYNSSHPVTGVLMQYDPAGTVHLFVNIDMGTFYYSRITGDQWNGQYWLYPYKFATQVFFNSASELFLVLNDKSGQASYAKKSPDGFWSEEPFPGLSTGSPTMDAKGNFYFLQSNGPLNGNSLSYRTARAVAESEGWLEQEMELPANLHKATLSYVAQLQNAQASPNSYVRVDLLDGDTTTPLAELRGNFNWQHFWSSLDPWLGKTVTLRFTLHQAANEPSVRFDLDDVSAGSWWTPVIESVSAAGDPWHNPPPLLTLHGQNFANLPAVWVDGAQLPDSAITFVDANTVTLQPANPLAPGCHAIRLTTPEGLIAEEPCGLRAGLFTLIPFVQR
jgi:hypothetical protein